MGISRACKQVKKPDMGGQVSFRKNKEPEVVDDTQPLGVRRGKEELMQDRFCRACHPLYQYALYVESMEGYFKVLSKVI